MSKKISPLGAIFTLLIAFTVCGTVLAKPADNVKSPKAVKKVMEGKLKIANAAWWGFDETDATEALQSAINSGAQKVIIPNMGNDWIVRPIKLAGNQELFFEKGTVITAKRGEYRGGGDCLFRGTEIGNLTINGYGAIWRMQKNDYIQGIGNTEYMYTGYRKAEWRMTLALISCNNVKVYGVTMKDSGGDGIYIGVANDKNPYCKDIYFKDVVCDNHYRQGISIISAENLLLENCEFKNTWGTILAAGVDIEPNNLSIEKLKNVVFRNCRFVDNYGPGISCYLRWQKSGTGEDVSVLFDNCYVTSKYGCGIVVGPLRDDGPSGLVEFKNCTVENTAKVGLWIYSKSSERALLRFTNCTWRNVAITHDRDFLERDTDFYPTSPFWIWHKFPELTSRQGGVEFLDCVLEDNRDRPFISMRERDSFTGVYDISGNITVKNPNGVYMDLGPKAQNITLKVNGK